ncbi:hypothetical protein ABT272_41555 [Streptomyces sp900105245]|uniref:Uncharacterized protein n=1 Tax=Streptomyces sp. 900105245 TaxID=3154379 RepID=A0ABV1ULP8_9ACTN
MDRDNTASVILRKRDLVKSGCVAVSTTFTDPDVRDMVAPTPKVVRAQGLSCVQGLSRTTTLWSSTN